MSSHATCTMHSRHFVPLTAKRGSVATGDGYKLPQTYAIICKIKSPRPVKAASCATGKDLPHTRCACLTRSTLLRSGTGTRRSLDCGLPVAWGLQASSEVDRCMRGLLLATLVSISKHVQCLAGIESVLIGKTYRLPRLHQRQADTGNSSRFGLLLVEGIDCCDVRSTPGLIAKRMCDVSVMIDDTCSTREAPANPANIVASDCIRTCVSARHDISAGLLLVRQTQWLVAKPCHADNRSLLHAGQTRRCRTFFASSASTKRAIFLQLDA